LLFCFSWGPLCICFWTVALSRSFSCLRACALYPCYLFKRMRLYFQKNSVQHTQAKEMVYPSSQLPSITTWQLGHCSRLPPCPW
jgi:hypothetical protein